MNRWRAHGRRRAVAAVLALLALVLGLVGTGAVTAHAPDPLLGGSLFAQDQPFSLKVATQLVVQTVSVTGKRWEG